MNVLINTETLDTLADTVAAKAGTSTPMTLSQIISAINSIHTNPTLQTKTKSYTPTTSAQSENVTADSGYDGLDKVVVNVGAIPSQYIVPSGNKAITSNGSGINVAQYATASVNVSPSIEVLTVTNDTNTAVSLEFTLKGAPKAFFLRNTSQLTRSSGYSYYYITAIVFDGTDTKGNYWRMSNGTFYNDTSHYSYSYNSSTKKLTISSSAGRSSAGGSFYNGTYELVYIY